MMNNIRKKDFREILYFLYFLQSVGFEPTYLPIPNRDTTHYAI